MKGRKTQIADKQIEKNTSLAEKGDNEVTEGESKKAVPDPIHEEFKKALKQFIEKAEYLDFSQWPVEDKEMLDPHHLNEKGAIRFTNELKKLYKIE